MDTEHCKKAGNIPVKPNFPLFFYMGKLLAFGRSVLKALTYKCIRIDSKQSQSDLEYFDKLEDIERLYLTYGMEFEHLTVFDEPDSLGEVR